MGIFDGTIDPATLQAYQGEQRKKAAADAAPVEAVPSAPVAIDAVTAPSQQTQMPATPAIANPQSQVIESGTSGWSTQTSKPVQLQGEKDAIVAGQDIAKQQVANLQEQGKVSVDMALAQDQAAHDKAALAAEKDREKQEALAIAKTRIDGAAANMKAKQDAYAAMTPKEFYGPGDTGRLIKSAIAVGLGGIADRLLGRRNGALDIIDGAAKDFRQREIDKISRGKNIADLARQDWTDSQEGKLSALKDIDIKYASLYDKAAEEYAAALSAKGVSIAQIQSNKDILALQKKGTDSSEETFKSLRENVVKGSSGQVVKRTVTGDAATFANNPAAAAAIWGVDKHGQPIRPSEAQGKSAAYLQQIAPENETLKKTPLSLETARLLYEQAALETLVAKNPGGDFASKLMGIQKTIEEKVPADQQIALGAARRWIDPILRQKSGAVLSPSDIKNTTEAYLPVKGDQPPALRAKEVARLRYQHSMATMAGADYKKILSADLGEADASPPAAPPDPAQIARAKAAATGTDDKAKRAQAWLASQGVK